MQDEIVEGLRKLGLTDYEARAYATLVGMGEATAREVHEMSAVPRTRIYDILRELEGKGFVEFVDGSPTYYRAVEPDRVMKRLKDELVASIDRSTSELLNLNLQVHGSSPVWCVRSEWGIKNRIRDFLSGVETELIVFCRTPDLLIEHRAELKKVPNLRIKVDKKGKFGGLGYDVQEMRGVAEKFFKDYIIDGSVSSIDGLMIADERSSIVVGTMGGERLAVIIRLPVVAMLQKAVWEGLV
ncbi:MAG TPA: TrmB family transcriptional regulator [Methanothrix sp.]|nr:TrmB family transcriptional regulator [Methanothrix sp.]HPT18844.1 TrmB family transcriptional regulator [Methanothrix sp.]